MVLKLFLFIRLNKINRKKCLKACDELGEQINVKKVMKILVLRLFNVMSPDLDRALSYIRVNFAIQLVCVC